MALMRGNPYVYRNGDDEYVIHSGGEEVAYLAEDAMEELAVIVVAALTPEQLADAVKRVAEKHGGNFGASAVMSGLGLRDAYEVVRDIVSRDMQ